MDTFIFNKIYLKKKKAGSDAAEIPLLNVKNKLIKSILGINF